MRTKAKSVPDQKDFRLLSAAAFAFAALGLLLRAGCVPGAGYLDPSLRTPDEMIYTTYASVAAHEGPGGVKIAVEQYNKNPKLWLMPPPTRIGYLLPLAGLMRLSGSYEIRTGILWSIVCSGLALLVLLWIARRFLDAPAAAAAVLFMAVSPMELAYAGKGWQESLLSFLTLVLIGSGLEIISNPRRWAWFFVYGAAGAWILLVKESGVVVLGLWTACVAAALIKEKRAGEAGRLLLAAAVSAASAAVFLTALSGGVQSVGQVYAHLRESVAKNAYAVSDQSGGWTSFIKGFLLLTPATLGLALPGAFSRRRFSVLLAVFAAGFIVVASIPAYFKNMRYLSPVDGPYYLLAGLGVSRVMDFISSKMKAPAAAAALLFGFAVIAGGDYLNYRQIFVQNKAKDLTNALVRDYSIYRRI